MSDRLSLPQITLCAVTSVNIDATIRALETCMAQIDFAACKLLTHVTVPEHPGIEIIPISPLVSSAAYSDFMLSQLVDHIETSHCLVVQWDGHVLDAQRWRPEFLDYDYIGASWPQYDDGHEVGNGGFSLRSHRLMEACRAPQFIRGGAEDTAIGRTNRQWLESQNIRFASRELADIFSTERAGDITQSFGYHGVFNMPRAIGVKAFWNVYQILDELSTVHHDFWQIMRETRQGQGGFSRMLRMLNDHLRYALGFGKR